MLPPLIFSPLEDESRRGHVETRLLVRLLPQHLQLVELTCHFGQDVSHRTRLFEHAVLERPDHVADRKGGDAGLEKETVSMLMLSSGHSGKLTSILLI